MANKNGFVLCLLVVLLALVGGDEHNHNVSCVYIFATGVRQSTDNI